MVNRRSFFCAGGILLAAPAVVRAESLMKIWTPKPDLILHLTATVIEDGPFLEDTLARIVDQCIRNEMSFVGKGHRYDENVQAFVPSHRNLSGRISYHKIQYPANRWVPRIQVVYD